MSISSYRRYHDNSVSSKYDATDYGSETIHSAQNQGGLTGFFSNLFSKWSGNKMTNAEIQAANINSLEAQKNRDWQEDMYNKYNTIGARMQQAEDAGVNPMMVATGGVAASPMSGSGAQGSASTSAGASSGFESLLGMLMQIAPMASELKTQKLEREKLSSEIKNIDANTGKTKSETIGIDIANWIKDQTKGFDVLKADLQNQELREKINNLAADSTLKGSQVTINGKQVDYLTSMIEVNESIVEVNQSTIAKQTQDILESEARVNEITSKIRLNNANAENIEAITPYMSEYYDSLIALQDARTDEAKEHASLLIKSTAVKALEAAKEKKLLDEGYYDDLIDKLHFETDTSASQSAVAEVDARNAATDASISNASAVVQIISSLISAFAGAGIGYRQFKGSPRSTRTTTYDANGNIVSASRTDQSRHFQ